MSQGSSIRGVDSFAAGSTSTPLYIRRCTVCTEPISLKRLQAVPGASMCVGCLEAEGDVPLLKRFDEYTSSGDRVETLFTQDACIEQQIAHLNHDVPSSAAYDAALGTNTEIDPRETEQIIQTVTEDAELDEMTEPISADEEEEEFEEDEGSIYEIEIGLNQFLPPNYYAATA